MGLENASLALINRVVAEWRATGKWPLTAVLRVQLKRENQILDELVRGMPFEFYRNPSEAGIPESERLILSPAAVELADGGLADVTPLLELIRRGVKRRVTDPYRRAFVTTDDLREILGPGRVKDLPRLLEYCAEFWAGGSGISHEPTISRFGLDPHSIRYEKVNSGEQYMALFNPQPPRVEEWDQLDDMHKELVRLVYEYWREHGKWPLLAEFMVQHRDKGDVYTKLKELPWTVLNTPTSLHDDQLAVEFLMSLRLRFLGFCVAAKDAEPSLFVRMLPIFHEHYEATVGSNKPITADEVAQRLGEPVEAVRRLAPLLEYEGHAGIVRTTPEDAAVWAVRITRDIDEWYDVKTIDDYIKRRIAHDKEDSSAERAVARVTARALGAIPPTDGTEPADFESNPFEAIDAPVRPLVSLVEQLRVTGAVMLQFAYPLGRDAGEVGVCIAAGANKAALMLCGGILEGVLTSVLMHNPAVAEREFHKLRPRKKFPNDASLPELVDLCRKELHVGLRPLLREVHEGLSQLINGHRNLIHLHAEIRGEQLPIDPHTVAAVLGSLQALLAGVLREIDGGWLNEYKTAV